jgi:hypothetical protein
LFWVEIAILGIIGLALTLIIAIFMLIANADIINIIAINYFILIIAFMR